MLDNLLKQYYELKAELEEKEKQLKDIEQQIKELMQQEGLQQYIYNDKKLQYITQERKKVDETGILSYLKLHNYKDCIEYKEVINEDRLTNYIQTNKIPIEDIAPFIKTSQTTMLRTTKIKK